MTGPRANCRPALGPACALGLDLGGTRAKLALVGAGGTILAEEVVDVPDAPEAAAVLAPIGAALDRLQALASVRALPVAGIGCGVSGFLDADRTRILINNTAALDGFALADWLRERTGLSVSLDNDACMAALAEGRLGDTPAAARLLVVTVGTGIGVVLLVKGEIARVHHGITGEAGHLIVDPSSSVRCPVGCRGCLETVASAPALARAGHLAARRAESPALTAALEARGAVSAADVGAAAAAGDPGATAILRDAGRWLGLGLATWAPLYAPDLVVLGGGVAQAGPVWLAAATDAMQEAGWPFFVRGIAVRPAALGARAGVIGAALAALERAPVLPPHGCGEGAGHAPRAS